jgi:hypothetical protein
MVARVVGMGVGVGVAASVMGMRRRRRTVEACCCSGAVVREGKTGEIGERGVEVDVEVHASVYGTASVVRTAIRTSYTRVVLQRDVGWSPYTSTVAVAVTAVEGMYVPGVCIEGTGAE